MMSTIGYDSALNQPWTPLPPAPPKAPIGAPAPAPADPTPGPDGEPETDLARLARLIRSNDRYLGELRGLRARLALAREFLADPASPAHLARAYHDRVRARQSRVLALLRANRIEALALLATLHS